MDKNAEPEAVSCPKDSERVVTPHPAVLFPIYGFANHTQKRERNEDVRAVFCSQKREGAGFFRTVTIWPSIHSVSDSPFFSFFETHDIRLPFILLAIADCKHNKASTIELLARLQCRHQ